MVNRPSVPITRLLIALPVSLARTRLSCYTPHMRKSTLTTAALSLAPDDRADLAATLLDSLESLGRPVDAERWQALWVGEIEARMRAVRAGTEPIYDAEEVLDELESELLGRLRRAS